MVECQDLFILMFQFFRLWIKEVVVQVVLIGSIWLFKVIFHEKKKGNIWRWSARIFIIPIFFLFRSWINRTAVLLVLLGLTWLFKLLHCCPSWKVRLSTRIFIFLWFSFQILDQGSGCIGGVIGIDLGLRSSVSRKSIPHTSVLLRIHHPQQSTGTLHLLVSLSTKWKGTFSHICIDLQVNVCSLLFNLTALVIIKYLDWV